MKEMGKEQKTYNGTTVLGTLRISSSFTRSGTTLLHNDTVTEATLSLKRHQAKISGLATCALRAGRQFECELLCTSIRRCL